MNIYCPVINSTYIFIYILVNSPTAVEHRNAGLRLPPTPGSLPSHRHPWVAPEPVHAAHHHHDAQAEARPSKRLHPHFDCL